jgi:NADH:ubiquinone oxidoreductase subunit E
MAQQIEITVCVGSSCFARGNSQAVDQAREYMEKRGLNGRVTLSGSLCMGSCRTGPNVIVNGERYCYEGDMSQLLDRILAEKKP